MRTLSAKVDDELYRAFRSICEEKGTTINAYLKKIVKKAISTDDKLELADAILKLSERRRGLECALINNKIALDELIDTFMKLSK